MRTFLVACVVLIFGLPVMASASSSTGHIIAIQMDTGGGTFVFLDSDVTGSPCAGSNSGNGYTFQANTDAARSLLSLLVAAKLAGSMVELNGASTCNSNYEYIFYVVQR